MNSVVGCMDTLSHYVVICGHILDERETCWNLIMERFPIELSVSWNRLCDEELITVLLGGPWHFISDLKLHIDFLVISINICQTMMIKVKLFTVT